MYKKTSVALVLVAVTVFCTGCFSEGVRRLPQERDLVRNLFLERPKGLFVLKKSVNDSLCEKLVSSLNKPIKIQKLMPRQGVMHGLFQGEYLVPGENVLEKRYKNIRRYYLKGGDGREYTAFRISSMLANRYVDEFYISHDMNASLNVPRWISNNQSGYDFIDFSGGAEGLKSEIGVFESLYQGNANIELFNIEGEILVLLSRAYRSTLIDYPIVSYAVRYQGDNKFEITCRFDVAKRINRTPTP